MQKWQHIEDLSESKELYEYCLKNIGETYNRLYEYLGEGFNFLTSETIIAMNSISQFFINLEKILTEDRTITSFMILVKRICEV